MAQAQEQMSWADIDFPEEEFSEDEVKDAEKGSARVPAGRFLCVCTGSAPKEIKTNDGTFIAANLTFEIERVISIEGQDKVTDEDQEALEGKKIWDDIRLEAPNEKQSWRNRRIMAARRLGLLGESGSLSRDSWSKKVLGREVILITEENSYTDKSGNQKTNTRVQWNGYESVDSPANQGGGEIPYAGI